MVFHREILMSVAQFCTWPERISTPKTSLDRFPHPAGQPAGPYIGVLQVVKKITPRQRPAHVITSSQSMSRHRNESR